jgi:hypothetical protein
MRPGGSVRQKNKKAPAVRRMGYKQTNTRAIEARRMGWTNKNRSTCSQEDVFGNQKQKHLRPGGSVRKHLRTGGLLFMQEEKHLRPGGGCIRQKQNKSTCSPSLDVSLSLSLSPYLLRYLSIGFFQNTLGNRELTGVPFLSAGGNIFQRTHGN